MLQYTSEGTLNKKINLTQAQILTLNTNPVVLLPAPGAGRMYKIIDVLVRHNFSGAAYATNVNLRIIYQGSAQVIASNNIILTTTLARIGAMARSVYTSTSNQYLENAALMCDVGTGNPTGGGGSIDIYIEYKIVNL